MPESTSPSPALRAPDVAGWRAALAVGGGLPAGHTAAADVARISLIEELELLRRTISAMQADLAVALDTSQRSQQADAGVPARQRGRGVAAQVALARQESPHRGQVFLGMAKAIVAEMPHTRTALRDGLIDEHAATLLVRETACLERADRRTVDELTCGNQDELRGTGTRRLVAAARRRSLAIDPASAVRRARRAESDRCVTLRPAPDTMAYLTALVPMAQGVAALATLRRDATAAVATGAADGRSRGQVMADLCVSRLTGHAQASDVPVEVGLVISDASLFGAGADPALLLGDGTGTEVLPAQVARELVARALDLDTAWIRRLYARPDGELVTMSSRQRFVRGGLAAFLRARDQGQCRTPWCDAPVRHLDHVIPVAEGGQTTAGTTQGLCASCNHAKQAPWWSARPRPGPGAHVVELTTPTGTHHTSRAPRGPAPAAPTRTALERPGDVGLPDHGVA